MKKILTFLLILFIISYSFLYNSYAENTQKKPKVFSSIISFAHTIFLRDSFHDEVSIYFTTTPTDKKGSKKVFETVIHLYKEFTSEIYKEIPANYPEPPRNTISIEVIQRIDDIAVIIGKGKVEIWKLFVDKDGKEIAEDIISKLREREA